MCKTSGSHRFPPGTIIPTDTAHLGHLAAHLEDQGVTPEVHIFHHGFGDTILHLGEKKQEVIDDL